MKRVLHGLLLALVTLAVLILPYRIFIGPIPTPWRGGVDAVTSPSVIIDAPSGEYLVLLNEEKHKKYNTVEDWAEFFSGESLVIMDDVSCEVMNADVGGIDMANSYRSRLPENQMKVRTENPTLLVSKAEAGYVDVVVMSREMAEALSLAAEDELEGIREFTITGKAGEAKGEN